MRVPTIERAWANVAIAGWNDCWEWKLSRTQHGYGQIMDTASRTPKRVHRITYESVFGPIPGALVIDHLCRNRACANPWHLSAVTQSTNMRRGARAGMRLGARVVVPRTHCKRGHPESERIKAPGGGTRCGQCHAERERERSRMKRGSKRRFNSKYQYVTAEPEPWEDAS